MKDKKLIAQRCCMSCRKLQSKYVMLRIVRTPEGEFKFDPTFKAEGHGAYLCNDIDCINKAFKHRQLDRAFKMKVSSDTYDKIRREIPN